MKREDLTALGITDDSVLDKIMSLHGTDVEKQKNTITTLTTARDDYKTQLDTVNTKLAGYDPEWKTKATQAETEASNKITAMQYEFAAKDSVSGLKFTSESAKKAFLTDLTAKKLPLQDGKLFGLDDFAKAYKETDPGAFASDEKPPIFSSKTPGTTTGALTDKDKANTALREAFGAGRKEE